MKTDVKVKPENGHQGYDIEPKFIDPDKLTVEQLTDPDYRLKQLWLSMIMSGKYPYDVTCSKCHHCRR